MNLYLGDCLDVMAMLPDASVDAIICDPPYGITRSKHDIQLDPVRLWATIKRISKPTTPVCLFAAMPFTATLVASNPRQFRYDWVWVKDRGGSSGHLNARKMPLRGHESICVFYHKPPTYNPQWEYGAPNHSRGKNTATSRVTVYGKFAPTAADPEDCRKYPRSWLEFPAVPRAQRHHSQEKPVPLLRYLIRTYTNPGETVLDFTMGSGSTGVACQQEGREFIGIEQDPAYFAVAERRCADGPQE